MGFHGYRPRPRRGGPPPSHHVVGLWAVPVRTPTRIVGFIHRPDGVHILPRNSVAQPTARTEVAVSRGVGSISRLNPWAFSSNRCNRLIRIQVDFTVETALVRLGRRPFAALVRFVAGPRPAASGTSGPAPLTRCRRAATPPGCLRFLRNLTSKSTASAPSGPPWPARSLRSLAVGTINTQAGYHG